MNMEMTTSVRMQIKADYLSCERRKRNAFGIMSMPINETQFVWALNELKEVDLMMLKLKPLIN